MTLEPRTVTNDALDKLPLFASDLEIAVAIVGKNYASLWKRDALPVLERSGFPRFDALHQGRPVPLIKQFYGLYFGLTQGFTLARPDGEEREWLGKRLEKKIDDEERRRAAGEDVPEQDPGSHSTKKLTAIAEYRAKKATEYAARNAR
ncbi:MULTISPECIES: hypothetical protein [unclassified Mesorhizobium]|uniref:hypothetical protein n=1 Tax=unclassified Mesorhizobium TaxID=325217 RepID=UPI00167B1447|nr:MULTISPECIES: hypothetical protein [unclassified Mesorhizobium]